MIRGEDQVLMIKRVRRVAVKDKLSNIGHKTKKERVLVRPDTP